MRTWVRGLMIVGTLAVCGSYARMASAQTTAPVSPTRDSVQSSVRVAMVYDDNVLAQVDPLPDFLLRVSPFVSAQKADPKRLLTASYGFDAERYDKYTELSAILARTNALASASWRPTPKRKFDLTGGFAATNDSRELNTTTDLATQRRRSNRIDLGGTFHQDLTRTTGFDAGYTGDRASFGSFITYTNGFDLRLSHKLSTRASIFVDGNSRQFYFGQLGGTTISNAITGGCAL